MSLLIMIQPVHTNMMRQPQNNLMQFLYTKDIAHTHLKSVERLTQESFISPELQWSILTFFGKQDMTINRLTGQIEDMPLTEDILQTIGSNLQKPLLHAQKENMKNAAHALLEATDIALFVASIESMYQPYNSYSTTSIMTQLKNQKQSITGMVNAINACKTIDQGPSSSYFSWIPYFGSTAQPMQQFSSQYVQFNNADTFIKIPATLMPTIIKSNSYKETSMQPAQAANLLFKQCFIAQQHHLKDKDFLQALSINLQSPITAQNYIFNQFPDLYNPISGSYPICEIAQKLASKSGYRASLQAPLTPQHQQAHQLLIHIRQAIQTALYIANKNSSYNAGSMLSSSVTSWLDGIVSQLTKHETYVANMVKNPAYGATQIDIDLEPGWSNSAKIAAGIVVAAAVIGTAWWMRGGSPTQVIDDAKTAVSSTLFGNKADDQEKIKQEYDQTSGQYNKNQIQINTLKSQMKSATTTGKSVLEQNVATLEKQQDTLRPKITDIPEQINHINNLTPAQTTSTQKSWFFSNKQPQNQQDTPSQTGLVSVNKQPESQWANEDPVNQKTWRESIVDTAGTAAWISGTVVGVSQMAKAAENQGLLQKGTYKKFDDLTGGNAQILEHTAMATGAVAGGILGGNALAKGWEQWSDPYQKNSSGQYIVHKETGEKKRKDLWNNAKDTLSNAYSTAQFGLFTTGSTAGGVAALAGLAAQGLAPLINQQQMNQQQTQHNGYAQPAQAQARQVAPQMIYEAVSENIHQALSQTLDPMGTLIESLNIIQSQNMTNRENMINILQQISLDNAHTNPEFAQQVASLIAQNTQS